MSPMRNIAPSLHHPYIGDVPSVRVGVGVLCSIGRGAMGYAALSISRVVDEVGAIASHTSHLQLG